MPDCRFDPCLGRYEAPSDTTVQRILAAVGLAERERVTRRWTAPHGKRIRAANRLSGEDDHWETATMADHATRLPRASRSYGEEGSEQAAMRALFEEVDLRGVTVTPGTRASRPRRRWWSSTARTI